MIVGHTLAAGPFKGKHVEVGTTFSMGHWMIDRGEGRSPIIWKNRHIAPGGVRDYGVNAGRSFHSEMEVISNELGVGRAMHVVKYSLLDKGKKANAVLRSVITF